MGYKMAQKFYIAYCSQIFIRRNGFCKSIFSMIIALIILRCNTSMHNLKMQYNSMCIFRVQSITEINKNYTYFSYEVKSYEIHDNVYLSALIIKEFIETYTYD